MRLHTVPIPLLLSCLARISSATSMLPVKSSLIHEPDASHVKGPYCRASWPALPLV